MTSHYKNMFFFLQVVVKAKDIGYIVVSCSLCFTTWHPWVWMGKRCIQDEVVFCEDVRFY